MSRIKTCVSLYSLQDEYLNHRMDLEQCMQFVKETGAEGVEILPDQMIKNTPDASQEELDKWHRYLKETGLKPVIADIFLNTNLYKNRTLTHRECVDLLVKELELANKMGLHLVRLVSNSAATGLVLDIFKEYGTDSQLGLMASIMMSSTETVLYCMSLYFGSVKITKTRFTLPGALLATAAGVAASAVLAGAMA